MEKQLDKYLRSVRRRLNMPKELKDRVMTDFTGSLEARLESGQSFEEILAELGSPKQAAKELNTQNEGLHLPEKSLAVGVPRPCCFFRALPCL